MIGERMFLQFAACRDTSMASFFPVLPDGDERDELTAQVRERCEQRCPVQLACALDALRRGACAGVIAGVDLGPGPVPRAAAWGALQRIADRVTSY